MKTPSAMKVPARAVRAEDADRFVNGAGAGEADQVAPKLAQPTVVTRRLTLDLPEDVHQEFKIKAIMKKTTMKQVLIDAAEAWIRDN
jgi:hypothetical protein